MTSRHDTPQPEPQSPPVRKEEQQSLSSLWWNTNVPPPLQTSKCPSYLLYAFENEKDRAILSMPDDLYRRQTWPEVQQLIRENRLEDFTRVPTELRGYRQFCADVEESHDSLLSFILKERLGWEGGSSSVDGKMDFEDPAAYKILRNGWPYGFDPRIVHLVVWTKFALPIDPDSEVGDMSSATKDIVQIFVEKTFAKVGEKVWFKNWGALKSVPAVEHIHLLLFDPGEDFLKRITAG